MTKPDFTEDECWEHQQATVWKIATLIATAIVVEAFLLLWLAPVLVSSMSDVLVIAGFATVGIAIFAGIGFFMRAVAIFRNSSKRRL